MTFDIAKQIHLSKYAFKMVTVIEIRMHIHSKDYFIATDPKDTYFHNNIQVSSFTNKTFYHLGLHLPPKILFHVHVKYPGWLPSLSCQETPQASHTIRTKK